MNVETIQVDPTEAREKLREYRTGIHRRADAEWQDAARAYEALATGTPVLSLTQAIHHAPRDEKGRPRLAIARADRQEVQFSSWNWSSGDWLFDSGRQGGRPGVDLQIAVPRPEGSWQSTGFALVPMVPPAVQRGHALNRHFILWEVEQWADRSHTAQPDRDPYLLKALGGDMYAVVGAWDLTDVERLVMARRTVT